MHPTNIPGYGRAHIGGYTLGDKLNTQRANEVTSLKKTTRCWIAIHAYIPKGHELHEEIPSGDLDCNAAVQNGRSLFIDLAVYTKECNILSLMSDRARLSKIDSWTSSSPPGLHFLGSKYFPTILTDAVQKYDPAGLFMAQFQTCMDENYTRISSDREKANMLSTLKRSLQGKRILNLAGGADKLVSHRFTKPFLDWLKDAASPHGIFGNEGLVVEEIGWTRDGSGHGCRHGPIYRRVAAKLGHRTIGQIIQDLIGRTHLHDSAGFELPVSYRTEMTRPKDEMRQEYKYWLYSYCRF